MASSRARPAAHWLDFPDTTYGLVGSPEFSLWDDEQYTNARARSAQYVIFNDAGTVHAKSNVTGLADLTGTDPAAVYQTAMTALAGTTLGGTIALAGALTWGSVPAIPNSIGANARIDTLGIGCKVTLTSAARRFLDFGKVSDHDTFRNFSLGNLTIDAASLGGQHHVILGTYVSGATTSRININNLRLYDIKVVNGLVDSNTGTNHRLGLFLVVSQSAANEVTQNTITGLKVQRVRIEGCNTGFAWGGSGITTPGLNVYCDDIHFEDCWHSLGAVQTTSFASSNYLGPSRAFGGRVTYRRCYGQYSADSGIEVNAMTEALVDDCLIEDSGQTGFYHTNYNYPRNDSTNGINEQRIEFRSCRYRRLSVAITGTSTVGFIANNNAAVTPAIASGELVFDKCFYYQSQADFQASTGNVAPVAMSISNTVNTVRVSRFKAVVEGISYTSGSATTATIVSINPANHGEIVVDGIDLRCTGNRSGSGALSLFFLTINGADHHFTVRNPLFDFNWTGTVASGTMNCIQLAGVMRGTIEGFSVANGGTTGDSGPRAIYIRSASGSPALTIRDKITIVSPDFVKFGGNVASSIFHEDATNKAKVYVADPRWNTAIWPLAAAAITPGASPYAYQNLDGYTERVAVQGGTVSKVEQSVDGTTYVDVGVTAGSFSVENGEFLRVTYSVVPTMTKIPNR